MDHGHLDVSRQPALRIDDGARIDQTSLRSTDDFSRAYRLVVDGSVESNFQMLHADELGVRCSGRPAGRLAKRLVRTDK